MIEPDATELDAQYFKQHPDERRYVRLASLGEEFAPGTVIEVIQLFPGCRVRQPL